MCRRQDGEGLESLHWVGADLTAINGSGRVTDTGVSGKSFVWASLADYP